MCFNVLWRNALMELWSGFDFFSKYVSKHDEKYGYRQNKGYK